MTDDVVVIGQHYGGEYLVKDFWGCCSILGALDRYCRNEENCRKISSYNICT